MHGKKLYWFSVSKILCYHVILLQSMINISDVSPLFVKGQHHPIMLTILQALLILIGEVQCLCVVSVNCETKLWQRSPGCVKIESGISNNVKQNNVTTCV